MCLVDDCESKFHAKIGPTRIFKLQFIFFQLSLSERKNFELYVYFSHEKQSFQQLQSNNLRDSVL